MTESLAQIPLNQRSPLHNFYEKRAAYIRDNIAPKVLIDLDQEMKSPKESELAKVVRQYLLNTASGGTKSSIY